MVRYSDRVSHDCEVNYYRLVNETKVPMFDILTEDDFPKVDANDVVVDAIFGSGLNRPPQGMTADLIAYLNQSKAIRVAIDIPSGLFADEPSALGSIFKADYTLTFQNPKLAFLLPENDPYVGRFEVLDIGLHPRYLEEVETNNLLTVKAMVKPILHNRTKYSHKGTYGHALLIAGSEGKTGAALLGAKACLRTGVGLLSVHLPKIAQLPMQTAIPEAMIDSDDSETCFSSFGHLDAFTAVGVGPGLGKADDTVRALKRLIQEVQVPLVMDADALNILAEKSNAIRMNGKNVIITPHVGEMARLVGLSIREIQSHMIETAEAFSTHHNVTVILKDAVSVIASPGHRTYENHSGNNGMATAGSGDVLAGLVTGLLATGMNNADAAVLGAFIHGLAGDYASREKTPYCMVASDIIAHMPDVFAKAMQSRHLRREQ
jgi:NAD(P)H-hydrate epimerase